VALLANLVAELLDRRVDELTERVEVGDLLVVVESDRSALIESKDTYIAIMSLRMIALRLSRLSGA
jgi:hypothetical protein